MDRPPRDPRMRQPAIIPQDEALIEPEFNSNTSRNVFGRPAPVNVAYPNFQGEGTSRVTDEMLLFRFSEYASCFNARVVKNEITCCSKGYGFVSFLDQQDAEKAKRCSNGMLIGSKRISCSWLTKVAGAHENKHSLEGTSVVPGSSESAENSKEMSSSEATVLAKDDPQCTTVFVSNLRPEVTQQDLLSLFQALGAGLIDNVRIHRDKGYGLVKYRTHSQAERAIQMGNSRSIKCSWGWKRNPTRTTRNPIPLPEAASSSNPWLTTGRYKRA